MEEKKNTCGGCFHFDACRKMMESVLDSQWNLSTEFLAKAPSCDEFIEASLEMTAFRAAEKLRGKKETKPSKKCVTIKMPLSEAMILRNMAGRKVDKVYDSIIIYKDKGIAVPSYLEEDLKEKSGIYDKIQQAFDDYYR